MSEQTIPQQNFVQLGPVDPELLEVAEPILARDAFHIRTVICYYCGSVPLQHWEGPRLTMRIFRVRKDFTPMAPVRL